MRIDARPRLNRAGHCKSQSRPGTILDGISTKQAHKLAHATLVTTHKTHQLRLQNLSSPRFRQRLDDAHSLIFTLKTVQSIGLLERPLLAIYGLESLGVLVRVK